MPKIYSWLKIISIGTTSEAGSQFIWPIKKIQMEMPYVVNLFFFLDTKNSYVYTEKGLVAVVGLKDVIVVQEGDTTLVCKRENAENI
jgi:hypothetical protein